MKIDILSLDEFIRVNECQEVTNPIFFNTSRQPTADGLFSYELFGISGSYNRKTVFGYINLKKPFLHPVVYRMLTTMDKRVKNLIEGSKYFRIVNGELIEDSENGETGMALLYENWDSLKFKSTDSSIREDKLDLMKSLKKNEAWVTKWPVIPCYYRDVNFAKISNGKIAVDEINNLYSKIIKLCNSISNDGFDFMGAMTENKVQMTLLEIYTELTSKLAKKTGYIRQALLGKSVDYATRSVISAPRINSEVWTDQNIRYTHTGVPLGQLCVLFFPYFIKQIQDFLESEFANVKWIYHLNLDTFKGDINNPDPADLEKLYLKNPMDDYTADKIKKLIELFIKSPQNRFDVLYVNTDEKGKMPLNLYYEDLLRPFTLTDLMYIVATKIVEDKHVYITRYPIEHFQNIYPTKIKILSTYKTRTQPVGDTTFKEYPDIHPLSIGDENTVIEMPKDQSPFIDTTLLNNSYLAALGGDYDGDMISIRAVYSQEANKECEDIIFSKKHVLDASGENVRKLGNEAVVTMYCLTKD